MKRQHYAWYAIALAILLVGLVFAGVSAQTILLALIALACPVMMFFMVGGHGPGSGGVDDEKRDGRHTSGQL